MIGKYFFDTDKLKPVSKASIALDNIFYAYGFGVYETIKIRRGRLFFPELHIERLMHSASIIGIDHPFKPEAIYTDLVNLVKKNALANSNIKIHLLGAKTPQDAKLFMYQLAPLYPTKKDKKNGAKAILYQGERFQPEAKSMNMLLSTLAFKKAIEAGAHDAILVNHDGLLTEGTRSNLFYIYMNKIITPSRNQVLHGVTRHTVIEALTEAGIEVEEKSLHIDELERIQGLFLTSTSINILPIRQVDSREYYIPPIIKDAQEVYSAYLKKYKNSLEIFVAE